MQFPFLAGHCEMSGHLQSNCPPLGLHFSSKSVNIGNHALSQIASCAPCRLIANVDSGNCALTDFLILSVLSEESLEMHPLIFQPFRAVHFINVPKCCQKFLNLSITAQFRLRTSGPLTRRSFKLGPLNFCLLFYTLHIGICIKSFT